MDRDSATDCRVALVGMMGSGKSTIGRRLAASTGWPYVDNDELVVRAEGASARRIAARDGERDLRDAEAMALETGLEEPAPCVIGVAAGTVLDLRNRQLLRDRALVVWLDAEPATLARRAAGAPHRPWLDGDAERWMQHTLEARRPLYAEVADHRVDTAAASPDQAVASIIDWLAGTRCPPSEHAHEDTIR